MINVCHSMTGLDRQTDTALLALLTLGIDMLSTQLRKMKYAPRTHIACTNDAHQPSQYTHCFIRLQRRLCVLDI